MRRKHSCTALQSSRASRQVGFQRYKQCRQLLSYTALCPKGGGGLCRQPASTPFAQPAPPSLRLVGAVQAALHPAFFAVEQVHHGFCQVIAEHTAPAAATIHHRAAAAQAAGAVRGRQRRRSTLQGRGGAEWVGDEQGSKWDAPQQMGQGAALPSSTRPTSASPQTRRGRQGSHPHPPRLRCCPRPPTRSSLQRRWVAVLTTVTAAAIPFLTPRLFPPTLSCSILTCATKSTKPGDTGRCSVLLLWKSTQSGEGCLEVPRYSSCPPPCTRKKTAMVVAGNRAIEGVWEAWAQLKRASTPARLQCCPAAQPRLNQAIRQAGWQPSSHSGLTPILVESAKHPGQALPSPGRPQQAACNRHQRHKGGRCCLPLVRHKCIWRVTACRQASGRCAEVGKGPCHPRLASECSPSRLLSPSPACQRRHQAHLPTKLAVGWATK